MSSSTATPAAEGAKTAVDEKSQSEEKNSEGKNAKLIICPFCPSKIFQPGASTWVEKEFEMHLISATKDNPSLQMEMVKEFWSVSDQFGFENIGVSKPIAGDARAAEYRYLICADCDKGPLGINFNSDPNVYYIANNRIRHA
jgi:hypothetical protein